MRMEVNVWVTSFVAKKQKMKQSECYKRMIERMKDQKKKTKKMRSKKKIKPPRLIGIDRTRIIFF